MHPRKKFFWKWDIWKEDYQKLSENLISFFMEIVMRNKKGQELVTSPFSGCQLLSEVFLVYDPS